MKRKICILLYHKYALLRLFIKKRLYSSFKLRYNKTEFSVKTLISGKDGNKLCH